MILCKDCIHYNSHGNPEFAKCYHPKFLDKITGESGQYCSIMRDFQCGTRAKYFEPISPDKAKKESPSIIWIWLKWIWNA